ncbi:DNA replication factor C, large subunit [Suhomyces tanzawaensis NRRL Y-17324]|uniref:Replication factor C subunit 1 n=1 Tax=Suhomyces tanzawaensis NRRL Y-17324 TaxID=984487 RepID=A0A1E4SAT6_9ASCO|nr:DNA replication factor C, large subunit [Suhomyces tanzawaensis NRRL Y-17324]ODV76637.1 DNA replication factor C, large subunit [Suhomyces tanzawaensis NRRL Y-17324]
MEVTEVEPPKKPAKVAASPKKSEKEVVSPKKTPKTAASPKKTPKTTGSPKKAPKAAQPAGMTADDVLQNIPDAVLPEVDEDKKFNFFAKSKDESGASSMSIDIPEAQPNCLSGLTIVFTGVLPRLDRDASENLAKRYGAKVTKSISGKTSLVVIGDEAGPSKVKKIKQLGVKAIDEDGFIQLLRSMPMEGGDGDAAVKARLKREEEELKIIEQARQDEENERKQEEQRKIAQAKRLQEQERAQSQAASQGQASRQPPEQAKVVPNEDKLWTVRHAPKDVTQLCGNKGQIQKLKTWLTNWFDNSKRGFKDSGTDGAGFRACLISGPPGIGKTSAAHLVAKELGFDILEKNASDVRSKSLLNANIKSVLNNTSVMGFFNKEDSANAKSKTKFCLIMDEVDGMSSGDHGGAGALSAFCRITKMPMILICNDKSLPKMRTFDRVTFDLPFRRPSETEVKSRLMAIAFREKVKLDPTVIGQLVQATSNDMRQMINLLSTVSKTQKVIGADQAKSAASSWKKQTILKPFDITARLLNGQIYLPGSNHSLNDKIDLYFNDIDFAPLMIQENYLLTRPMNCKTGLEHLERVASAADDISQSDRVNSLIRSSEQQWSLLPFHGVLSSVSPSAAVAGNVSQRINFAGWLGQNSKAMKYQRILQELQYHTRLRTSTDKKELRLDYLSVLAKRLSNPILTRGEEGIEETINVMDYYYLTKEDWDSILDLGVGESRGELVAKKIPTKVKTAFTRKYNGGVHPTAIYKTGNSLASAAKKSSVDYEDVIEDDTNEKEEAEEEDSDKIDEKKDKLIKKKASKAKPKAKPRAKKAK